MIFDLKWPKSIYLNGLFSKIRQRQSLNFIFVTITKIHPKVKSFISPIPLLLQLNEQLMVINDKILISLVQIYYNTMQNQEWEVQKILQRGRLNGMTHYLVQWKGFPEEEATWEPIFNLQNCQDSILEFESFINGQLSKQKKRQKKQKKDINLSKIFQKEKSDSKEKQFKFENFHQKQPASETDCANPKTVEPSNADQDKKDKQYDKITIQTAAHIQSEKPNIDKGEEKRGILRGRSQAFDEDDEIRKPLKRLKLQDNEKARRKPFQESELVERNQAVSKELNNYKQDLKNGNAPAHQLQKIEQMDKMIKKCAAQRQEKLKTSLKVILESHNQNINTTPSTNPIPNESISFPNQFNNPLPPLIQLKPNDPPFKPLNLADFSNPSWNLKRYQQCDEQNLTQKKLMLRNIMRKEMGLQLNKSKMRMADWSSFESALWLEIGNLKRLNKEVRAQKLEMLIKTDYCWMGLIRNKEEGLFLSDVNLIREDYWATIVEKHFSK